MYVDGYSGTSMLPCCDGVVVMGISLCVAVGVNN